MEGNMGLFGSKPIYKCRILEKYKIDIEKENCDLVGETAQYRVYCFKADSTSSTYLLRQEKLNPKKVVYLGQAKNKMCVCGNKVYAINRINYTSRTTHPLYCIDIETGESRELPVLSDKGCYIAMHWHCQDCVESIALEDGAVVMDVTRYKENSHYEEELKYRVYIRYENGKYSKKYSGI